MSSPIQIRNVPDDQRRVLRARAAARGESLNRYLLRLIEQEVSRPTVEQVLARAAQRSERAQGSAVDELAQARAERESKPRS